MPQQHFRCCGIAFFSTFATAGNDQSKPLSELERMSDGFFPDWMAYAIIAMLIAVLLYWKFSASLAFLLKGKQTRGVISNWMMAREGKQTRYYPMIEFALEDGTVQRYRAEESCEGAPLYAVGTEVQVKYLKNDPKTVRTIYPPVKS